MLYQKPSKSFWWIKSYHLNYHFTVIQKRWKKELSSSLYKTKFSVNPFSYSFTNPGWIKVHYMSSNSWLLSPMIFLMLRKKELLLSKVTKWQLLSLKMVLAWTYLQLPLRQLPLSNQVRVVMVSLPQLTQASFLQKRFKIVFWYL